LSYTSKKKKVKGIPLH